MMDVGSNSRFYKSVQDSGSDNSGRLYWEESITIPISFDYLDNYKFPLNIHKSSSKTNYLFRDHSTNQKEFILSSEFNVHCSEGKDFQVYVWQVSPLWTSSKQRGCSQQESKLYEDFEPASKSCSNNERRRELQTSFGKLCRVGTLEIAKWKKRVTQRRVCNYVLPKHEHKNVADGPMSVMSECCEQNESKSLGHSVSMVVDAFIDESVRHNIAASICNNLSTNSSDPEMLDYFYECIAEFGFEHIIVIGELLYGLLFLDCYGRVFQWEEMEQVLWPLGNSLEEVKSRLESNKRLDRVIWTAEDDHVVYKTLRESLQPRNTIDNKGVKTKHTKKQKK